LTNISFEKLSDNVNGFYILGFKSKIPCTIQMKDEEVKQKMNEIVKNIVTIKKKF